MAFVGSGLSNLGNTCFLNATLQCLLHAPAFVKLLQQKTHSRQCNARKWCVFCEMERLWQQTQQHQPAQPSGLVRGLPSLFKKFRLGRQEDAHEFLRYVVEGLQKADIDGSEKKPERIRQLVEASQLFRTFGGKMKSSIECLSCHAKSEITEHFYDMSLECQQSNSVGDSLEAFFKVDLLSGDNRYRCEKCKKLSNAHKRFLFHKLPQVLTIQLKRFTNNLQKLDKTVRYEPAMNLTKYCDNQQKQVHYYLFGVIVHEGKGALSGHYYAYVQAADLNWYRMDDSYVGRSNLQQSLHQKSYILFYRLVQQQEPETKNIQMELSTYSNNDEAEKPKLYAEKKEPSEGLTSSKVFYKRPTSVNGVVQLVEKKPKPDYKQPEKQPHELHKSADKHIITPHPPRQPPQLRRTNSYYYQLLENKRKNAGILILMEKHFSIEYEYDKAAYPHKFAFEECKYPSSRSSSEESRKHYVAYHPRPLKRPRCPSHQKALLLLRQNSRGLKRRKGNESNQKSKQSRYA